MFIKKFDYLSPPISFYYQGSLSHSSIISGIISIFSILIIMVVAIYFSLDIINRDNPSSSFYIEHFIEDIGTFPLNASYFFHFVTLNIEQMNSLDKRVDFRNFRIIGIDSYYHLYLYDNNLSKFDHWLYGYCNNESDTQGISYLIDFDFYFKSACIKKYFSSSDKKYYDIGDTKFRWPEIGHGIYHHNNKIYSLIIEKCKNNTINLILGDNTYCKTEEEIYASIGYKSTASLYFIDNYINILNYKNPYTKFINNIENIIQENGPIIHLNFNPTSVKTHKGFIFDNTKIEMAFRYENIDIFPYPNYHNNKFFTIYNIWLHNRLNYYERFYKRIQDVVSDIGGVNQVITIIATFINKLYSQYVILYDTEFLLFSLINSEIKIHKNNSNNSNKLKNTKIKDLEKRNLSTNIKRSYVIEKFNNKQSKSKDIINKNNNISNSNNKIITNYEEDINVNNHEKKLNKSYNKEDEIKKISEKDKQKNNNFWNYLLFKIYCGKKNKNFKIYNDFRVKIISEEHLIRNHLNIYNLLRISEKKIKSKKINYRLKDLMKII